MKLDDHIALYATALEQDCGIPPDMALLLGVTQACGPLIYAPATERLTKADLPSFRKSLVRKLSLTPGPSVDEALQAAWEACDTQGPRFRAVLLYILALHFGKADLFRPKAG